MEHTFTLSGLGKAPFNICHPSHPAARKNHAFFCEHCGTALKSRSFVISGDGKVSVVGIDCLNKTGDAGLVAGAKRVIRELQELNRMNDSTQRAEAQRQREREQFDGKTKGEVIALLEIDIENHKMALSAELGELAALGPLSTSNFGRAMTGHAIAGRSFTNGMTSTMIEVCARHLSGAKENTKAYKAALPESSEQVGELVALVSKYETAIENLRSRKKIELLNR